MSEIKHLRPRRGTKTNMTSSAKSSLVLDEGEIFIECPDEGIGKGKSKIKIGDGVTAYAVLPYALGASEDDSIYFIEDHGNDIQALLNAIIPGATLGTIISKIKRISQLLFNKFDNYYTTSQMDTIVNNINGRIDDTYTKSQIDTKVESINTDISNITRDLSNEYYTKTQVDNLLSNYYNKTSIDSKVQTINNSINTVDGKFSDYYTKTQVDSLVRIPIRTSDPTNPQAGDQWILKN